MFGDALGVMLVLALGGLMIPIVLILLAVMADLAALLWLAFHGWHDRLWPAMARAVHLTTRVPVAPASLR